MDLALWIIASALAVVFALSGLMKFGHGARLSHAENVRRRAKRGCPSPRQPPSVATR